ncbi:class I SAM-dependent methyltransferase [Aeromicrobium ginsengisoli]|uniref:class I SAM-dependent methyltransferase n=1 Tax=Aeromicrobium ginsengisoli TaxID=363867 RepID=UPI00165FD6D3|nr:class I SAM-dependent methyltransferase [Aeromicrobium ginsengisoli]
MTPDDPALSFGAAADTYDRARPPYPDEVVDWLLDGVAGPVVDVGAGTGKLTAALAARRDGIVAVEPDAGMRSLLARIPGIDARAGSAEEVPVSDGATSLVTMAQAWHWVDVPRASAELARVLDRPGRLGLVWNYRSAADEWVVRLSAALGGADSAGLMDEIRTQGPSVESPFGAHERLVVAWDHVIDVDTLVALAASRSYVIVRPPSERDRVLSAVRELGEERAGADGSVRLPYETYAFRFDLT